MREHEREFTGSPGSSYRFWISSIDASGNRTYAGPYDLVVE